MATNNSQNSQYANNADGFTLGGGTTSRSLTVTGGNVTVTGAGSNTYAMPAASDTLVGRASTDTLTNKDMTSSTNLFPTNVLGYTEITSNFTTTTTGAYVDVTGLSTTVTVPTTSRGLKITLYFSSVFHSSSSAAALAIREGSTTINQSFVTVSTVASDYIPLAYISSPTAGSHTYKASVSMGTAGTLTVQSTSSMAWNTQGKVFIMVELA